ncbi:condensation domain-containing protein [Streptomyces sp. NBC_01334]|uniref:condensation domain-containing protein n=1 Tax=Streptomyces sp. NBC_01334 TaxID=2903827 RepID=UPI003FA3DC57
MGRGRPTDDQERSPEADATSSRPAFSYLDLIRAESTRPALDDRSARLAARAALLREYGAGGLLPGRTAGPAPLRHRYDEEPLDFSTGQTRQLLHAAGAARVSLYSLLAAAFAGALGRHFGRERVILSTPFHGRLRPEHHTTVGEFANMVQIPVDVSQGGGHRLLRQTHEALREASATVDLPFGLLAEAVLGRSGDVGFFRYALGHAALRLHGVTGWALDQQRDDAIPMHGMRTELVPISQDSSRLTYATRQASDTAAATFALSLTMTQDARLSGALRHERAYTARTPHARSCTTSVTAWARCPARPGREASATGCRCREPEARAAVGRAYTYYRRHPNASMVRCAQTARASARRCLFHRMSLASRGESDGACGPSPPQGEIPTAPAARRGKLRDGLEGLRPRDQPPGGHQGNHSLP